MKTKRDGDSAFQISNLTESTPLLVHPPIDDTIAAKEFHVKGHPAQIRMEPLSPGDRLRRKPQVQEADAMDRPSGQTARNTPTATKTSSTGFTTLDLAASLA